MAVSKRLRFEILRRDNHTCRYCGGTAPDVVLTVDHVVPTALGGTDEPSNLVAACKDCNAGKSSVPAGSALVDDVQNDAIRWGQAIVAYNQAQAEQRGLRDAYVERFNEAWLVWHCGPEKKPIPRDEGWLGTIWRFHDSGLPVEDLIDAVQIACGNAAIPTLRTWVYFCGVAWKRVNAMQDGARELLDSAASPQDDEIDLRDDPRVAALMRVEHERLVTAAEKYAKAEYTRGGLAAFEDLGYSDVPHRLLLSVVEGCSSQTDAAYGITQYRWVA